MTMLFELNPTDHHFADFIHREAGIAPDWFRLAVSLASNAVGNGNICLNLADIAGKVIQVDGNDRQIPALSGMCQELAGLPVVGSPGEFRPLVLDDDGRLYLYRYWQYERELVQVILAKAALPVGAIDEPLLAAGVARLFPDPPGHEVNWQKVAALGAIWKKLCVISGGPGTGKTSTVVKILALLLEQAKGENLRIALAAPTGKSAARLKESIRNMKAALDCSDEVKRQIPDDVTTLHRLLGVRAGSVRFRHSEENRLPFSVVIVDEASMVALPLMAKLAVALEPGARVILLGDRDQLASVEAGAALGDICGGGRPEPYSLGFQDFVARVAGEKLPVTAASEWGGPTERKNVRPALAGSIEELLHETGRREFIVPMHDGSPAAAALEVVRLGRAIGVIYLPRTERQSHYFHVRPSDQFDAMIHIDTTSALEPLEPTSGWIAGQNPETYPSGL